MSSHKEYNRINHIRLHLKHELEVFYYNLNTFYDEYLVGENEFEDDRIRISEISYSIKSEIEKQKQLL